MIEATFEREKLLAREDVFVIGVDEVGRGPLAGPVVAAAAHFKDATYAIPPALESEFRFIRDSKTLSEVKRERMFAFVQEHFAVGIGRASVAEIDRLNILQAALLAMQRAFESLKKQMAENRFHLLIDGNRTIEACSERQEAVIGGDGLCKSIAAASIAAKVTRDRLMLELDQEFPQFGWAKNKGYGTREHMEALRRFGPTVHHRQSFAPVMMANPENVNRKFARVLKPKK